MTHAKIAIAAVVAAMALSNGAALASPPDECTDGPNARSYADAYQSQARFLEKLFETSYGCDRLESFSRRVGDLMLALSTTDPCRAAANRDAANDTIDKVTNECLSGATSEGKSDEASAAFVSCSQNGREAGRMRAELYCNRFEEPETGDFLAPEAPPTGVCSQIASLYCSQAFRARVSNTDACRQGALSDPHYRSIVKSACAVVQ